MKVPFTVPNANANSINVLLHVKTLKDYLKSTFSIIDPKLGKVGGLYLKKIIRRIALIAAMIAYTNIKTKK